MVHVAAPPRPHPPQRGVLRAAAGPDHPGAAGGQAGQHGQLVQEPHGGHREEPAHQEQGQVGQRVRFRFIIPEDAT